MPDLVQISVHSSQFPNQVRHDLLQSLRSCELNHKFLYDGLKQTRKWLALHQACSPSRTDPDCAAIYDEAFQTAASLLTGSAVHLLGLGCGGGQKDARCLGLLLQSGRRVSYTPLDVSTAMVLTARTTAMTAIPGLACTPVVCDLDTATELPATIETLVPRGSQRLMTFFGMIPNFEPGLILPRLAALAGPNDLLLFSANLAPGVSYAEGMRRIIPLYDNPPTRDWLLAFLYDLGVEPADGILVFTIEDTRAGLKRVVARFHFQGGRTIRVEDEQFVFCAGDSLRVFFSYRYQPSRVPGLLADYHLEVLREWITPSGEEGVFLVRKSGPA